MNFNTFFRISLTALALGQFSAHAMTPAELQQLQTDGKQITVIDARSNVLFQKGHIPGAINVPASLIAEKNLPPLGKVVVYDDGLGRTELDAAVTELNKKPGIEAEALEGGFAAWEMNRSATTQAAGLAPEKIEYITYQELKASRTRDLVLVDLRKPKVTEKKGVANKAAPTPFADLGKEFPGARVAKSPFDLPQSRQSIASEPSGPPLLVLIDNGDGSAQEMARALKGNGNRRLVILSGGEEIISREGKSGLQRRGLTTESPANGRPTVAK